VGLEPEEKPDVHQKPYNLKHATNCIENELQFG
jgi:hypothetical protein